ncbi:30S ribosomal protein S12 methylthiotransferase accessory factor YcaO [Pontibacterium granulatum]|uniref:30S ribosomal protein S12 methylthiotransferase accessory factor YcaO n=1 Tax=Pontibacterium granulatum TaxID=2036029 RepID=UPI00249C9474|nr:30S ribosomal protein S12 methylthiotransferase accessory factor YcaO [Pontibacterium granulatum]MDI3325351.1 30S ribosomal protein S12 methylthiotransferase accessory factor YcaO [Pontibacterium granulatum]
MTRILGKDAPVDESITRMTNGLRQLGFDLEEVNWWNPVPNVWSVLVRDRNCPLLFTNGKGASREAALASALGEFFERLSCNHFFAGYFLGSSISEGAFVHYPNERWFPLQGDEIPAGLLDEPTLHHYNFSDDLKGPMLVDTNSGNAKRGICAIPFERQRTGDEVWIPINIIGNLYVSNGMAAGNSKYEARVQALSEIFKRHIKNTIISSGISLPGIPDEVVARYPKAQAAIDALREQGFGIVVKDASLGGKFPLVNITLLNPENSGVVASFGAHPKFEVALERALTELLRGRTLDQLDTFSPASLDIRKVADQKNIEAHLIDSTGIVAWDLLAGESDYEYTEWNIEGDSKAEFDHLCYLIHRVDMDIYITDYDHLGMYACRIIVPGMSEIYPVETLVRDNNAAGVSLRMRCLNLPALDCAAYEELLEALEDLAVDDQRLVAEFLGIVTDPDTPWETMRVGELKALLNLMVDNLEAALTWVEWTLQFGEVSKERSALFRCLAQCLAFELDGERNLENYESVLRLAHKQADVDRSLEMLKGEGVLSDLPCDDGRLRQFGNHSRMLEVYQRLQDAKTRSLAA